MLPLSLSVTDSRDYCNIESATPVSRPDSSIHIHIHIQSLYCDIVEKINWNLISIIRRIVGIVKLLLLLDELLLLPSSFFSIIKQWRSSHGSVVRGREADMTVRKYLLDIEFYSCWVLYLSSVFTWEIESCHWSWHCYCVEMNGVYFTVHIW